MTQQIRKALHDRKTEAKAAGTLARWIVKLVKFVEDRANLPFGNADAGVPDLDMQLAAASPATEQNLALIGVFERIRYQVPDYLLEQGRIASDAALTRNHPKAKSLILVLGLIRKLALEALEQGADREIRRCWLDDSGLKLVYVEHRVQHGRHRIQ